MPLRTTSGHNGRKGKGTSFKGGATKGGRMKERRDFTARRRITIGATAARCESCGSEEFFRAPQDSMRCCTCGTEYTYTALLGKISVTARERAARVVSDAEALHDQMNRHLKE
jgi:hypothetical protein